MYRINIGLKYGDCVVLFCRPKNLPFQIQQYKRKGYTVSKTEDGHYCTDGKDKILIVEILP